VIEIGPAVTEDLGAPLSEAEVRFLRHLETWRGGAKASAGRTAGCESALNNGYATFDGEHYHMTRLGKAKLYRAPYDVFINLVAVKEFELWNGRQFSDFWQRHETAVKWANQRDFDFDRNSWEELK
jgi:hypothetical protein